MFFDAFLEKSDIRGEPGIPSTSRTVEGGFQGSNLEAEGAKVLQVGEGGRKRGEGGISKTHSTK